MQASKEATKPTTSVPRNQPRGDPGRQVDMHTEVEDPSPGRLRPPNKPRHDVLALLVDDDFHVIDVGDAVVRADGFERDADRPLLVGRQIGSSVAT